MKLLLDTHIFLWFINNDQRLPTQWRTVIQIPDNEVYLSVVSLWEVILKYQLGKINLPESPDIYIPKQRKRHFINHLDLSEKSVTQLIKLPLLHRDPFDRMLMAQAINHSLTLMTIDSTIQTYSVEGLSIFKE
ncbi:MAG: type II toxin-antitoxin system VapC family toxin [Crocosphaera sp.]|nr:type II toxin-antitoxin system VapC family toxin [Crocosphaera sp.]